MTKIEIKKIVENLIDTFLHAGKVSLDLRNKGLAKKIKSDNTPVSNGDIEVDNIITWKYVVYNCFSKIGFSKWSKFPIFQKKTGVKFGYFSKLSAGINFSLGVLRLNEQ